MKILAERRCVTIWRCLIERLRSANYRNFDLLINYPGDKEANSTDYDLITVNLKRWLLN
jgi:hypothetical protein